MFAYFNSLVSVETSAIDRSLIAIPFVLIALFGLYQWLLPKPVPGIAYNQEATRSLLGDAPSMIKEVSVTGEFRVWCAKQVKKMNSPICQVFIRPFGNPWILLADFRESKDILTRRKEFDKSSFLSDGMACMGSFHGIYTTGDKFKSNRQLIQDLMTTTFLNSHVGPAIYNKGLEVLKLFEKKMNLADGRPFSVKKDFEHASLDVMLEFAFGKNWLHTSTGPQLEHVCEMSATDVKKSDNLDQPVEFPLVPIVDFLHSVYEAPEIVEKTINAIMPKLQTWWWSKQSWYQKIFNEKDRVMTEQMKIGLENYKAGDIKTGVEHMLMREGSRAEREGRTPNFTSKVLQDEMFGNIIGGHHTTSGAMMWLVKYLTDLPHIQKNLRAVLYDTLSTAKRESRLFTFEEIRRAKLPYWDAVIEEMLRLNAVTVTREAMCDTTILGCPIKKGTQVFFVSNGPGFLSPSISVDDTVRSETSRAAKIKDRWDESQDLTTFAPERWLVRKNDGEGLGENDVEFDGAAGPQLVFGLGPRACWGRRLAHMEMKTIIAMLVWDFELLPTPPAISSHAGLEGIARVPQQCYLRLRKL
ncbi:Cytochrome P450 1A4 [Talaromyces islandicus]|uniref:Cytochrome P450 1A4 n=1 Tax=Talaromyces islandicus TaxID=28573 RepID=A0A0U1MAR8_TALIS|nr:Cytochrome P450 1A4 [Talaromyces islandicus]